MRVTTAASAGDHTGLAVVALLLLFDVVQALSAQRLDGALGVTRLGAAGQVGHDVVRHGQRHTMVVDFDDEGFAGFLLLGFLRTRSAGHGCRWPPLVEDASLFRYLRSSHFVLTS